MHSSNTVTKFVVSLQQNIILRKIMYPHSCEISVFYYYLSLGSGYMYFAIYYCTKCYASSFTFSYNFVNLPLFMISYIHAENYANEKCDF